MTATPFEASPQPPKYQPSNELLPQYTPTIEYIGLVKVREEMHTPYGNNLNHKWGIRILELNSTQVKFYALYNDILDNIAHNEFSNITYNELERSLDVKQPGFTGLQSMGKNPNSNFLKFFKGKEREQQYTETGETKIISELLHSFNQLSTDGILKDQEISRIGVLKQLKGKLVKSFTLQRSQIGSASDYDKTPFALRLRLEMEQMIIQTPNFKEFLNWYWKISIGIQVSMPLELRKDAYKTLPPHSSSRRRSSHSDSLIATKSSVEEDNTEIQPLKSSLSESDLPSLIETISHYVEEEDRRSLLSLGDGIESDMLDNYEYLQLMLMSRCIKPLTRKDNWIGKSVVIYDKLPQIEGYIYNPTTSKLFPKSFASHKDSKSIEVRLVRQRHLSAYSQNLNKGKIPKLFGDEYLISSSGLVHRC